MSNNFIFITNTPETNDVQTGRRNKTSVRAQAAKASAKARLETLQRRAAEQPGQRNSNIQVFLSEDKHRSRGPSADEAEKQQRQRQQRHRLQRLQGTPRPRVGSSALTHGHPLRPGGRIFRPHAQDPWWLSACTSSRGCSFRSLPRSLQHWHDLRASMGISSYCRNRFLFDTLPGL
jgi:hypothetical protein